MKQFGKDLLATNLGVPSHKLLFWNVYTDTDFEFQNKKTRQKCTKLIPIYYNHTKCYISYQLFLPILTQLHVFTYFTLGQSQKYINILKNNKSSVINQLEIIGAHLPSEYRCLVVHTSKSGANVNNSYHRYISYIIFSHDYLQSSNVSDDLRSSQFTLAKDAITYFSDIFT